MTLDPYLTFAFIFTLSSHAQSHRSPLRPVRRSPGRHPPDRRGGGSGGGDGGKGGGKKEEAKSVEKEDDKKKDDTEAKKKPEKKVEQPKEDPFPVTFVLGPDYTRYYYY